MIIKNLLVPVAALSAFLLSDVADARSGPGIDQWSHVLARVACKARLPVVGASR